MENKEDNEEIERQESEKDNLDVRLVKLSSTFSNHRYIFYSSLRVINSILVTSNVLWYTHYYIIRKDEDKVYSYFTKKPKQSLFDPKNKLNSNQSSNPTNFKWDLMKRSREHNLLEVFTVSSFVFCVFSNILLKLQKRSLTKLLTKIKSSHIIKLKRKKESDPISSSSNDDSKEDEELRELEKKMIYLKQSDLQLLDKWKVLLGGIKYWLGSIQTTTLYVLYIILISETTHYDWLLNKSRKQSYDKMQHVKSYTDNGGHGAGDDMQRYFQYTNETQEIEWPEHVKSGDVESQIDHKPVEMSTLQNEWQHQIFFGSIVPSFFFCYTEFPTATLWFVLCFLFY